MSRTALVLGAGIVGTCTALHLLQRGWEVALVDRRGPGEETSFGNAGVIQREAVEPFAFPRHPLAVARAALGTGAEVHYHFTALPRVLPRLWTYFRTSAPAPYARAARGHSRLIEHCLREHDALIRASGAADLIRREGFLFVFRTQGALDEAAADARRLHSEYGVGSATLDSRALRAAEPALQGPLAGAVHWTEPWTVTSPGELVKRYAALFEQQGGHIIQADALRLQADGSGWRLAGHTAEHAVIALGPWSAPAVRRFGYAPPLFVKRGYHRHYAGGGLRHTVLDAQRGYVLAPMKAGTRLTTGAELALLDAPATPVQLRLCEQMARDLVALGAPVEAEPWLGNRPCVADMLPIMGPAPRHPTLWFNFGHSHQGFTLGPVAGRLVAQQMSGEQPLVDPAAYLPARFG